MRTITIQKDVYTFNELDYAAKQRAIQELSQDVDYDFCYEDFVRMGGILGIEIDTHPVRLINGNTRQDPSIWWSGFYSQGDGLAFDGSYRYAKGAVKAIKAETNDAELIRIAQELQEVQRKHFYRLEACIKNNGGDNCIKVSVEDREDNYRDISDAEGEIRELMRDFADWMYGILRDEYEYHNSEAALVEMCKANELEFDENGVLQ